MARRRARTRTRTVTRYVRRGAGRMRRGRRRSAGTPWKKILMGAGYGLATSIGGYYLARATGRPIVGELGQRGASVIAAKKGGWKAVIAYQVADALFDRGVIQRQTGLQLQSGTIPQGIA